MENRGSTHAVFYSLLTFIKMVEKVKAYVGNSSAFTANSAIVNFATKFNSEEIKLNLQHLLLFKAHIRLPFRYTIHLKYKKNF